MAEALARCARTPIIELLAEIFYCCPMAMIVCIIEMS